MSFLLIALLWFVFQFVLAGAWNYGKDGSGAQSQRTKLPDIETAIVDLIAVSMRADGFSSKSELVLVKNFLLNGFGESRAKAILLKLRDTLKYKQISDIRRDCVSINNSLTYRQKLALVDLFLAIAAVDQPLRETETQFIRLFVRYVRIDTDDFYALRSRYFSDEVWYGAGQDGQWQHSYTEPPRRQVDRKAEAYKVLGLSPDADMAQVKQAYRKLAKQWHPDRFASKSAAEQEEAAAKFREINEAYKRLTGES